LKYIIRRQYRYRLTRVTTITAHTYRGEKSVPR